MCVVGFQNGTFSGFTVSPHFKAEASLFLSVRLLNCVLLEDTLNNPEDNSPLRYVILSDHVGFQFSCMLGNDIILLADKWTMPLQRETSSPSPTDWMSVGDGWMSLTGCVHFLHGLIKKNQVCSF